MKCFSLSAAILTACLAMVSSPSIAFNLTGVSDVTIVKVNSYAQYGGGDTIVSLSSPLPGCDGGLWLMPTDPGFKTNLAMILSAKLTGNKVTVYGDTDILWPGSPSKFCRFYTIGLE